MLCRRRFLQSAAAVPCAVLAAPLATRAQRKDVPIGLEMFTLRTEEAADRHATLKAVAEMGYAGVEFYGIYVDWTPAYAKEVRKTLDSLGLKCFSTHTRRANFAPSDLPKVAELNTILGSKYVVMAHSEKVDGEDGWKRLAESLAAADETLKPQGLRASFHNYPVEFRAVDGKRPIDILTANTPKDFRFQLDTVGPLQAGADIVDFIRKNPGRIKSYHLKDWRPGEGGGRVLLGEGVGAWPAILDAAENVGGVEYYLIEQEGSRFTPLETAKRSIDILRGMRSKP